MSGPTSETKACAGRAAPSRTCLIHAAVLGLVAGFLSGLFGVGGGILIVPVLVLAMAMDQRLAHGTSLAAVLPIAAAGVISFAVDDSVDWPVAASLVAGAMVGAIIGTHWLHKLPSHVLAYAFAGVLLASAARLLLDDGDAPGRKALTVIGILGLAILGLLSGTLAGLLGVGGGVVMVPAMIILFGVPAAVAKGTSLGVIIPTSVVATLRNARKGNADLRVAFAVGLSGVVSAYVASQISVGLDESTSNALFAALLSVVAARMILTTRRQRRLEAYATVEQPSVRAAGAASPAHDFAARFTLRGLPLLASGSTLDYLGGAENLWLHAKVFAGGGENALHEHVSEDHAFFVVQGSARFEFGDLQSVSVGVLDGVIVPKGTLYRFEAVGEENLVMLRVGGAQLAADAGPRTVYGAPAGVLGRNGPDGRPLAATSPKNRTGGEAGVPLPGRYLGLRP